MTSSFTFWCLRPGIFRKRLMKGVQNPPQRPCFGLSILISSPGPNRDHENPQRMAICGNSRFPIFPREGSIKSGRILPRLGSRGVYPIKLGVIRKNLDTRSLGEAPRGPYRLPWWMRTYRPPIAPQKETWPCEGACIIARC